MNELIINNVHVNLTCKEGKVFATSLDVANVFEKEHKHVREKIKTFTERARSNFRLSSYINSQNREMPMFEMNRDGFSFLVMGFTGEKADNFKLDFIDGFNQMEEIIRKQSQKQIPTTPMEALREFFEVSENHDQRIEHLEKTKRLEVWQAKRLKDAVDQKVMALSVGEEDKSPFYRKTWGLLKDRFTVRRYDEIPCLEFNNAVDFVNRIRLIDLLGGIA